MRKMLAVLVVLCCCGSAFAANFPEIGICTGERVVCMRERATGKLHELRLIRSDAELDRFCEEYGLEKGSVKTVY